MEATTLDNLLPSWKEYLQNIKSIAFTFEHHKYESLLTCIYRIRDYHKHLAYEMVETIKQLILPHKKVFGFAALAFITKTKDFTNTSYTSEEKDAAMLVYEYIKLLIELPLPPQYKDFLGIFKEELDPMTCYTNEFCRCEFSKLSMYQSQKKKKR